MKAIDWGIVLISGIGLVAFSLFLFAVFQIEKNGVSVMRTYERYDQYFMSECLKDRKRYECDVLRENIGWAVISKWAEDNPEK